MAKSIDSFPEEFFDDIEDNEALKMALRVTHETLCKGYEGKDIQWVRKGNDYGANVSNREAARVTMDEQGDREIVVYRSDEQPGRPVFSN
jgi:hypothetical protein